MIWGEGELDKITSSLVCRLSPSLAGNGNMVTVQNGGAQPISEILHIENQIVCCIMTYFMPIYYMGKCSRSNKKSILMDFVYVDCVF